MARRVLRFRITRFSGEVGRANMIELGWKNPHADRYWLWMSNRSLPDCYFKVASGSVFV